MAQPFTVWKHKHTVNLGRMAFGMQSVTGGMQSVTGGMQSVTGGMQSVTGDSNLGTKKSCSGVCTTHAFTSHEHTHTCDTHRV